MFSQPALNASLNGISALLLAGGYAAIRAGKMQVHKRFMVSAFWVSVAFLASYVTYHIRVKQVVLFQGQGWIRPVYFALLLSHTILAIVIVPMILVLRLRHRSNRRTKAAASIAQSPGVCRIFPSKRGVR